MKIEYAVQNLRSIKHTKPIELKPINILVGRNSAGKSSFIRTFPLLKQSIETRSSAPILWWGDNVDFGDFKTSVHNRNERSEISFHYRLTYDGDSKRTRRSSITDDELSWSIPKEILSDISAQTCSVDFFLGSDNEKTVRRATKIEVVDRGTMSISFDATGRSSKEVRVNDVAVSELIEGFVFIFPESNMFSKASSARKVREEGRVWRRMIDLRQAIIAAISAILKPLVDGRTIDETIQYHAHELLKIPGTSKEGLVEASNKTSKVTFKKLFLKFSQNRNDASLRKIVNLCSLYYMSLSLNIATERLRETFLATSYLKPVRVRGERFTRSQELEVSEVSPDGSNLPVFLASLYDYELLEFSNWVESLYGYGIAVVTGGGQISIMLVQGKFKVNVADTGYGISQILPVLAKTWWSTTKSPRKIRSTIYRQGLPQLIVMEQPELHLHPAHQARLADVFVNAIGRSTGASAPIFLIETHSETLINRLGEMIEDNPELRDSIQILIFTEKVNKEPQPEKANTGVPDIEASISKTTEAHIEIANFDAEGALQNWPYGFFGYKQ